MLSRELRRTVGRKLTPWKSPELRARELLDGFREELAIRLEVTPDQLGTKLRVRLLAEDHQFAKPATGFDRELTRELQSLPFTRFELTQDRTVLFVFEGTAEVTGIAHGWAVHYPIRGVTREISGSFYEHTMLLQRGEYVSFQLHITE